MTQPPNSPSSGDPGTSQPPATGGNSGPLQSPVEGANYADTPYGPVPTDLYSSADANTAVAAQTSIRRWQTIAAIACAAAALVIIGFFIVGEKGRSAGPTHTVTNVVTDTQTETETTSARNRATPSTTTVTTTVTRDNAESEPATVTRTETQTETERETVTRTTVVTVTESAASTTSP